MFWGSDEVPSFAQIISKVGASVLGRARTLAHVDARPLSALFKGNHCFHTWPLLCHDGRTLEEAKPLSPCPTSSV